MFKQIPTILVFLLITGGIHTASAQQDTSADSDSLLPGGSIHVIARASLDSVVLRWAPDSPAAWIKSRKAGFSITRAKIDTLVEFDSTSIELLNEEPITPWSLETWEQRVPEDNDFALMAAEALYGERFVLEPLSGNNPIEALRNAADELNNRFGFALLAADNDLMAAEGLGLRYVDRNVEEGATYIYTVSLSEADTTFFVNSGTEVVDIKSVELPPPPLDLSAESGEGSIMLSWRELPNEAYSGYYIYRSSDGGNTYKKMNEEPHFFMTGEQPDGTNIVQFVDTSAVNYQRYHYQVRGITPFTELSQPAEVLAMAKDMTPPPVPAIQMPEEVGQTAIRVTWTYPDTVGDLEGFYISRSSHHTFESSESLMEEPLPAYTRSFVDSTANMGTPWYFVIAVDTAGNAIPSFGAYGELIDKIPPSVPTGFSGEIDSTGIVSLKWNLGPETDLKGYRLLYANDPTHEFSTVTSMIVRDTTFIDTITVKTLTKSIYYKIAAIDQRFNQSEFSEILKLERPDVVPPNPPVFSDVSVTDTSVVLNWYPSNSKDLHYHVLYRKLDNVASEWDSIASFSTQSFSYTDTAVVKRTTYRYRIQAVDSAGLASKFASTVQARPYDKGILSPPTLTAARYDSTENKVVLEWDYQKDIKENHFFILYRSPFGSPPVTLKAVEGNKRSFEDQSVVMGNRYQYAVKIKTRNGKQSEKSNVINVSVMRNENE